MQQQLTEIQLKEKYRWLFLVLVCISLLGSYYCYDIPSSMAKQFEKDMSLTEVRYSLLYSVYSLPNIILPFFGGIFVDKLGTSLCMIVFSITQLIGHAIFCTGVTISNFPLMLVGRGIFGLGGESLTVAQSTVIAIWFKNKELALALGLTLSISRLGSVFTDNMGAYLYNYGGLKLASWFGLVVYLFSFFSIIGIVLVDRQTLPADSSISHTGAETRESFKLIELFQMSRMFWLLISSCVIIYCAIIPFNIIAGKILDVKFNLDLTQADFLLGVPFMIAAVLCPIIGFIIDKIGKRGYLVLFSNILLCIGHSMLGFTNIFPLYGLIIFGIAYSLYASVIWPCFPMVVGKQRLGTAYGTAACLQSTGFFCLPLLNGAIYTYTLNYEYVEMVFVFLSSSGILISVFIIIDDFSNTSILNNPASTNVLLLSDYDEDILSNPEDSPKYTAYDILINPENSPR